MSKDLTNDMVFTMSIGQSNAEDWLQHGACDGTCTSGSLHTISNIKINTAFHAEMLSITETLQKATETLSEFRTNLEGDEELRVYREKH